MDKIRILIADDFRLLCEDLRETLNAQDDMEVVAIASSGEEAVRLVKEMPVDLILMDIEMENASAGIHAAKEILDLYPDILLLFLTAYETDQMIITSMGVGAVDYIVKDGDPENLLAHIRAAYEGHPIMSAQIHRVIMKEYSRLRRSEQSLLYFINNVSRLTTTERELVHLLLEGKTVREIAAARCVEQATVKTQIKGLLHKFGCTRTKEIVRMIRELELEKLF